MNKNRGFSWVNVLAFFLFGFVDGERLKKRCFVSYVLSGGSMEKGEKTQSWPGTTQIDRKLSVCTQRVHIASRLAGNPCFKLVFLGH